MWVALQAVEDSCFFHFSASSSRPAGCGAHRVTGGVAQNLEVVKALTKRTGGPVYVSGQSMGIGAIGAASPVGSEGQDLGETMEAKTKNILKATVRSIAERRGPSR